jgi:hypothetical protein
MGGSALGPLTGLQASIYDDCDVFGDIGDRGTVLHRPNFWLSADLTSQSGGFSGVASTVSHVLNVDKSPEMQRRYAPIGRQLYQFM